MKLLKKHLECLADFETVAEMWGDTEHNPFGGMAVEYLGAHKAGERDGEINLARALLTIYFSE